MKKYFLITFLIVTSVVFLAYSEEKDAGTYRYVIGMGWGHTDTSFTIPYPAHLEMNWTTWNYFKFSSQMNTALSIEPVEISFIKGSIFLYPATDSEGNEQPLGHYDLYVEGNLALAPDGNIYFKNLPGYYFDHKAWQKPYKNTEKSWNGELVLADWASSVNPYTGVEEYDATCSLYLFLKDENGQYSDFIYAYTSEMDCRTNKEAYKDLLNYIEFFQTNSLAVINDERETADGKHRISQISGGGAISFIDPPDEDPMKSYKSFKRTIESPEGVFSGYVTYIRLSGTAEGKPVIRDCHLEMSYHIKPEGAEKLPPLSELTISRGKLLSIKKQPPDGDKPIILKQMDVVGRNWSGSLIYDSAYEGTQYDGSDTKRAEMFFFVTASSPLDVLFTLRFKTIPPSNLPAESYLNAIHVTDDTIEDIKRFIKDIEITTTRLDPETRQVIGNL